MALTQQQYDTALANWRASIDGIRDDVLGVLADVDLDLDARGHKAVLAEVDNLEETVSALIGRLRYKLVPPPV